MPVRVKSAVLQQCSAVPVSVAQDCCSRTRFLTFSRVCIAYNAFSASRTGTYLCDVLLWRTYCVLCASCSAVPHLFLVGAAAAVYRPTATLAVVAAARAGNRTAALAGLMAAEAHSVDETATTAVVVHSGDAAALAGRVAAEAHSVDEAAMIAVVVHSGAAAALAGTH